VLVVVLVVLLVLAWAVAVVVVGWTVVVVLVTMLFGPSGAQIIRATFGVAGRVPNWSSSTIEGSSTRGHRTL
jgi:ABC-type bacteriocin/lantibiotic exporter with double-glycine peptidase domain